MDLGEQYDCVASLILDLKSAAESAWRLGSTNLARELEGAVEWYEEELCRLGEQIDAVERAEAAWQNRAYERSVI